MKIIVMRHGEAEIMANSDPERCLTARGKTQATEQGKWLKQHMSFDKVIVSPYLRAQQTFDAINFVYDNQLSNKMETWDGVTPNSYANFVINYLELLSNQGIQRVLIISHLPLVSEIISSICSDQPVRFYPATFAEIDWQQFKGKVIHSRNVL